MARKKQKEGGSKILKIIMLIPALMSLMGNLYSMLHAELSSMRKKLVILALLAAFSIVLMLSVWLCVNALLFTYMVSLHLTTACVITLILSLNFLLLIITCLMIAVIKIDASFPETRKAVNDIISR